MALKNLPFEVRNDIPLPDREPKDRAKSPIRLAVEQLQPGQSVVSGGLTLRAVAAMRAMVSAVGKRNGWKFMTKSVKQGDGLYTLTAWRLT